jgi:excisionase family DNA binding protein
MVTETRPGLLTIGAAAARLRVHPNTLRKWVDAGRVQAIRRPGGGGFRMFEPEAIERLRQELGLVE